MFTVVKEKKKAGFTMVELLVVLIIVAILAAVAAPIYLASAKHAKASDAVAVMSMIRQAEREFNLRGAGGFKAEAYDAASPAQIQVDLSVYPGVSQYFSINSFKVETSAAGRVFNAAIPATSLGNPTTPVDFMIEANGTLSKACNATVNNECAVHGIVGAVAGAADGDLGNMCLQMDNSGRVFVSYDSANCAGGHWDVY